MKILKALRNILYVGTLAAVVACQNPALPTPKPSPNNQNELSDNTHVLTSSEDAKISTVSGNSITVSNPGDYSPNEVIVSDISNQTPDGLLRKVTSVSGNTVYTTQATLEDAVKNVDFEGSSDIDLTGYSSSKSIFDESKRVAFNFNNVVVYDADGKSSTTYDQAIVNGGVSLILGTHMNLKIKGFHLDTFLLEGDFAERSDFKLNSRVKEPSVSVKKTIFSIDKIPRIRFLLPTTPPLPVIIRPVVDVFAGLNGNLNIQSGLEIGQDAHLSAGLSYQDGEWGTMKSFVNVWERKSLPNVAITNLKGFAGADINFLFYGGAGPYVGTDAYLRLASESGSLNLYGGLEAIVGGNVKILGKTFVDQYAQIPITEKPLLSLPESNPTPPNNITKTLDIQPGSEGKDTYFREGHYLPNNSSFYENGGPDPMLEIDNYNENDGTITADSFIQFPLSSIPSNSVIDSAKLELFGTQNSYFSNVLVEINKVTSSWDEYFQDNGPSWDPSTVSSFYLTGNSQWYEADITSLVRAWMNGNPNYGVIIHNLARTSGDFLTTPYYFYSSDNSNSLKRPLLEVTYETQN